MIRYLIGIVVGSAVTFCLFLIMHALVSPGGIRLEEPSDLALTTFVPVREDAPLEVQRRRPEPPPPPDQPPPPAPRATLEDAEVTFGTALEGPGDSIVVDPIRAGFSDGEYLPIVKVAPVYPRRALSRGIEGWVVVAFTVTRNGSVRDPVVVAAEPAGIFDRAAMNAALKFKYKPKVVNGEPIEVPGVRNRIVFELAP